MPYGERRPGPGAPKGNTNALKSGRYSACLRAVMAALSQNPELCDYFTSVRSRQLRNQRRAAGEMHTALLEVIQRAPTRSNPRSSPILAEDTPWANRPGKGPGRKSIKGGPSNSFGKGAPPGNNSCFTPRPASKDDKKTRTILQRELIKWHFCSPRRPSSPTTCCSSRRLCQEMGGGNLQGQLAGLQDPVEPLRPTTSFPHLPRRHSRESGNPGWKGGVGRRSSPPCDLRGPI